jgi:hypothetical protein
MSQQRRSTSPNSAAIVVAVVVIVAGLLVYIGRSTGAAGDLTVRRVPAGAARPELADPGRLMVAADNVFVGRVLAKVGQRDGAVPQTRFRTEVLESFKGDLSGDVIVNQHGGYHRRLNELVLVFGDSLLEPGRSYLIATTGDTDSGLHVLIPVHGDVPIDTAQQREQVSIRFRTAAVPPLGGGRVRPQ